MEQQQVFLICFFEMMISILLCCFGGFLLAGHENVEISLLTYDLPKGNPSTQEVVNFLAPWTMFVIWFGLLAHSVTENAVMASRVGTYKPDLLLQTYKLHKSTASWLTTAVLSGILVPLISKGNVLMVFPEMLDPYINFCVFFFVIMKCVGVFVVGSFRFKLDFKLDEDIPLDSWVKRRIRANVKETTPANSTAHV